MSLLNFPSLPLGSIGIQGARGISSCHDSVIDFWIEHGIMQWNGFRYWLVMTTYSYADSNQMCEDQYLYCSNNGISWDHAPLFNLTADKTAPPSDLFVWSGYHYINGGEPYDATDLIGLVGSTGLTVQNGYDFIIQGWGGSLTIGTSTYEASGRGETAFITVNAHTDERCTADSSMIYDPEMDIIKLYYAYEDLPIAGQPKRSKLVLRILSFVNSVFTISNDIYCTFGLDNPDIGSPTIVRTTSTDYHIWFGLNEFNYSHSNDGVHFDTPVGCSDPYIPSNFPGFWGAWHYHGKQNKFIPKQIDFVMALTPEVGQWGHHGMELVYGQVLLSDPTTIHAPLLTPLLTPVVNSWSDGGIYVADLVVKNNSGNFFLCTWFTGIYSTLGRTGYTSGSLGSVSSLTIQDSNKTLLHAPRNIYPTGSLICTVAYDTVGTENYNLEYSTDVGLTWSGIVDHINEVSGDSKNVSITLPENHSSIYLRTNTNALFTQANASWNSPTATTTPAPTTATTTRAPTTTTTRTPTTTTTRTPTTTTNSLPASTIVMSVVVDSTTTTTNNSVSVSTQAIGIDLSLTISEITISASFPISVSTQVIGIDLSLNISEATNNSSYIMAALSIALNMEYGIALGSINFKYISLDDLFILKGSKDKLYQLITPQGKLFTLR